MLTTLRDGAKSGFLKYILIAFIGLAVLGLVFVDMSGSFRDGVGSNSVARVGDTEIPLSRFMSDMQDEENRTGMREIPEQLRQQMAYRVVDQLVRERVFQLESQDMDLLVDDRTAAKAIKRQLAPLQEGGLTAEEALAQRLRATGMDESRFVDAYKQDMAMRKLLQAVSLGSYTPQQMVETAYKHENQMRAGHFISLELAQFNDKVGDPDQDELQNFYEENINNYLTPEYREVSYFIFDDEAARLPEDIPEEELRAFYEDRISRYTQPAGRIVDQAIFTSADTAQDVVAEIFDSADLSAGLESLSEDDYVLLEDERITEDDALEDIAEAAFATPIDDIAGPIETSLGWVVLKVKSETEETVKPFEEVRDTLEDTYREEEQQNRLYDMANEIDDRLISSGSLGDVAREFDLEVYQTPLLTKDGLTKDGNSAEILQKDFAEELLADAFTLRVDEMPPLMDAEDESFVAYNVNRIDPAAPKPLEDIKDQVTTDWRQKQMRTELAELGDQLMKELKEGRSLTEVAADHDLEIREIPQTTGIEAANNETLPEAVLQNLFQIKKAGDVTVAPILDGAAIVQLDDINFPDEVADAEQTSALRETMKEQIRTEIMIQYETALREKYDVKISDNAIRRALQPVDY
ncbi:MAG: peptidyl-prolyl cis-trans isomerase [Pseudomonadota bacterium]